MAKELPQGFTLDPQAGADDVPEGFALDDLPDGFKLDDEQLAPTELTSLPRRLELDAGGRVRGIKRHADILPPAPAPSFGETIFGRDDVGGDRNVEGVLPSLQESFKPVDWSRLYTNTKKQVGADLVGQLTGAQAMLHEGAAAAAEHPRRPGTGWDAPQYRHAGIPLEARAGEFHASAAHELAIAGAADEGSDEAQANDAGIIERTLQGGASSAAESAAGLVTGGPALSAIVLGAGQGGQRYAQLRNRGESTASAAKSAALTAGLEGLTEYLPGEALFDEIPGFKARLVKFMATEVPGEEATTLGELVDDYAHGIRDNITAADVAGAMSDTLLQTIVGGAIQAGGAHLAQNPQIVAEGLKALVGSQRTPGAGPDVTPVADSATPVDVEAAHGVPADLPPGFTLDDAQSAAVPTVAPTGQWQADPDAKQGEPFAFLGADPAQPEASLIDRGDAIEAILADGTSVGRFETPDEAASAAEAAVRTSANADPAELGGFGDELAAGASIPAGLEANLRASGFGDLVDQAAAVAKPHSAAPATADQGVTPSAAPKSTVQTPNLHPGAATSSSVGPAATGNTTPLSPPESATVATGPAVPDRRQNTTRRKTVSQMTANELRSALLTHELTGIPNRRAYEEAPKLAHQTAIDVDSLKWVNDNMGHDSGNELLKAVAEALRDETGGQDVYHLSGDEFALQSATPERAAELMQRVNDRLAGAVISVTMPDGKIVTLSGVGVSYGTGTNLATADAALQSDKTQREQTGERAARGVAPAGATHVAAETGRQDHEREAAAENEQPGTAAGIPHPAAARAKGPEAAPVQTAEDITLTHEGHVSSTRKVENIELSEDAIAQRRAEQRAAGEEGDALDELDGQIEGEHQARIGGLKEAIETMLGGAKNAPRIIFVDGVRGIPRSARARMQTTPGREISGAYDPTNDRVYINTAALESKDQGVFVAAHEIAGHLGLRGFVGRGAPDARKKLDAALKLAAQNPYVDGLAEAIRLKRTRLSRLQGIEEALAELAAAMRTGAFGEIYRKYGLEVPAAFKSETAPAKKGLRAAIDNFLRRLQAIFEKMLGYNVSDAQVRELLEGAWRYVQTGETVKSAIAGETEVKAHEEQTHTAAFKKWFGKSVVVDEHGEPLVVYHGTNRDFKGFAVGDVGFHFGTEAHAGWRLADKTGDEASEGNRVLPVYLKIENPLRTRDVGAWHNVIEAYSGIKSGLFKYGKKGETEAFAKKFRQRMADFETGAEESQLYVGMRDWLESKGYDGIVYENVGEQEPGYEAVKGRKRDDSWIAFQPNQIKSAVGNAGTFDASKDDIALTDAEPESTLLRARARKLDAQITASRAKEQTPAQALKTLQLIAQQAQLNNKADAIDRKISGEKSRSGLNQLTREQLEERIHDATLEYFGFQDTPASRALDDQGRKARLEIMLANYLERFGRPALDKINEATGKEIETLRETRPPAKPAKLEHQVEQNGKAVEDILEGDTEPARKTLEEQLRKTARILAEIEGGTPGVGQEATLDHLHEEVAGQHDELVERYAEMFGDEAAHAFQTKLREEFGGDVQLSEDDKKPQAAAPAKSGMSAGPGKNYVSMYHSKGAPAAATPAQVRGTAIEIPKEPIRREHVMQLFQRLFHLKIYEGKPFKVRSALGFFRPSNYEIRNRAKNDLEVAAHEVFHWLDRTYPAIRKLYHERRYASELKGVSYDESKLYEGFAEFGRLFMTQEAEAVRNLPTFYEAFVKEAAAQGILTKLEKVQRLMHQWYLQGAEARALSKIGEKAAPLTTQIATALDGWQDRAIAGSLDWLQAAKVIEREIEGDVGADAARSPYKSLRLLAGVRSTINTFLNYKTLRWAANGELEGSGKGLSEILAPVADVLEETLGYFVAQRADELRGHGKERLFKPDEIKALRDRAEKTGKLEAIKTAHAEYQEFTKRLLDFAVQSGILSPESRALWEEMYKNYVPMHRVADKLGGVDPRMSGGNGAGGVFKRLKGGTQNVRETLENITRNTALIVNASMKNMAKRQLFATIESSPLGQRYAVRIPTDTTIVKIGMEQIERTLKELANEARRMRQAGLGDTLELKEIENLAAALGNRGAGQMPITDVQAQAVFFMTGQPPSIPDKDFVMVRGKPRYYQIGDGLLWRMLQELNYHKPLGLTEQIFGLAKRTLTRGVTIAPVFQIRNVLRDTLSAFTLSRSGQIPFVDSMRALRDVWKESDDFRMFLANGGGFGNAVGDETKAIRLRLKEKNLKIGDILDSPRALLEYWDKWGQSFELATRLAEYKKTLKKHPELSRREAAFRGREVSTDFAVHGHAALARWLMISVSFFNARLQGLYRIEREIFEKHGAQSWKGDRAVAFAMKGTLGLTLPALLGYLVFNHDDPDYEDLPEEIKSLYTVIPGPDGKQVLIPRPFEVGAIFQELPIRLWRYYEDRDGKTLMRAFKFMLLQTFNFNPTPTAIQPIVTIATNTNWNGLPIVPRSLQDVEPREQYRPWTPETYVRIGKEFNVSPSKLQAVVEGYFGNLASGSVVGIDALVTAVDPSGKEAPRTKLSTWPLVSNFVREQPYHNTSAEEKFYDLLDEITITANTARLMRRQARADDFERFLGPTEQQLLFGLEGVAKHVAEEATDLSHKMNLIRDEIGRTPEQRQKDVDDLQEQQNELFRQTVAELSAAKLQKYRDALEQR